MSLTISPRGRSAPQSDTNAGATAIASQFSTVHAPVRDRLKLWEEYNSKSMVELRCRSLADASLLAAMKNVTLPRLRFTEMRANTHLVERLNENIRSAPADRVLFCLLLEGSGFQYRPDGIETLSAGDAIIYDSDSPFLYGVTSNMRQAIVEVPRSVYGDRTGNFDPVQTRVLRRGQGSFDLHADTMIRIMKESLATPPADPWSVEESVLDLLELLTGATAGTAGAYLLASREFIRTRLHEADLSVPRIARAVGVSERHLARIFAAEGSNVSKEILQARLGRASDMLADTRLRDTSIGAIAASVGFASAAHFSRAFRQAYGRTPREAREGGNPA